MKSVSIFFLLHFPMQSVRRRGLSAGALHGKFMKKEPKRKHDYLNLGKVCEGAIGLGHAVHVFALLHGLALFFGGGDQLFCQFDMHWLAFFAL